MTETLPFDWDLPLTGTRLDRTSADRAPALTVTETLD
jgi:hypothetical protein